MQVIYSNFCNVTPTDSNFQIYSLTNYHFLPLIHSNFSQKICPYFCEDGCVCTWSWDEEPDIKVQHLTMPQPIWYKLERVFLHLSSVSVKETGDNFSATCFISSFSLRDQVSVYVPLRSRAPSTGEPKLPITLSKAVIQRDLALD